MQHKRKSKRHARPLALPTGALLTVNELASYLKIAPKTLYNLAAAGKIPHVKVGGSLRFVPERIEAWAREGGELGTGVGAA